MDPGSPCGIPKFKIAAALVPEFVTVAESEYGRVVVAPTATVAAFPSGIPKYKTRSSVVPLFITVAALPGGRVVVAPILKLFIPTIWSSPSWVL